MSQLKLSKRRLSANDNEQRTTSIKKLNKQNNNSNKQNKTSQEKCPHTQSTRKLCTKNECKICYNRSFASSDRAQYWSEENKEQPRNVFKLSNKKYKFNCDVCNHTFESALSNITNCNSWCPY